MPDILISENIQGPAIDALAKQFDVSIRPQLWRDHGALAEAVQDVRGLIIRNQTKITPELLRHAKKLKVIGRAGVGLENVAVQACTEAGVIVTSTPEQNALSVAELAIGLMVCLARHIIAADADTKQGGWNRPKFSGTELYGKTFGIVGAGKIGFLTAARARAFGMNIVSFDPYVSQDSVYLAEVSAKPVSLEELFAQSDVVSCHLPATPQTLGLINAECFALMKPTAYFINTSRGEVVNEADLYQALVAKKLAGAALDVRSHEPPVVDGLEKLPNVILVPHIAALTHEAQNRVTKAICDDITRVFQGRQPLNPVVRF